MRNFTVGKPGKLLETLFEYLSDAKKTRVREALKRGLVAVNGEAVTQFDRLLKEGDEVKVFSAREARSEIVPPFGVEIVFEDGSIIVAQKPAGLLTIATETVSTRTAFRAVNEYVRAKENERLGRRRSGDGVKVPGKQIFVVHRIDREVSGLLIFAKNAEVKESLQAGWREAVKRYYVVVEGVPEKRSGTISSFLRENRFLKVYSSKNEKEGKLSVTHYRVLRVAGDFSLLEVELGTGRKHQIRVHLSDLGHPIAGDERYGAKTDPVGRVALHAYYLALNHPASGEPMVFETPLPEPFQKILNQTKAGIKAGL